MCLNDHRFYAVNKLVKEDWTGPLQDYGIIDTIFGLGFAAPEANSFSFLARAVSEGLLNDNVYAMQMASSQSIQKYGIDSSHIQLGGYDTNDFSGEVQWYNLTSGMDAWNITVTSFKLDSDDLLD